MSIAKNEEGEYFYYKNINNMVTPQLLRCLSKSGDGGCNEYNLSEYYDVEDIIEVICECAFNGWSYCNLYCDPQDKDDLELMEKSISTFIDIGLQFSVNYLPELKEITIKVSWV